MRRLFRWIKLTLLLTIIGCVILVVYNWNTIKMNATETVLEKVTNDVLGLDMDVSKVIDTLDTKEKEQVMDMLESYVTDTNVKKITSYVKSKDINGAKEYLQKQVKQEDMDKMIELYQEHENEVKSYIGNQEKMDELLSQYGGNAQELINKYKNK